MRDLQRPRYVERDHAGRDDLLPDVLRQAISQLSYWAQRERLTARPLLVLRDETVTDSDYQTFLAGAVALDEHGVWLTRPCANPECGTPIESWCSLCPSCCEFGDGGRIAPGHQWFSLVTVEKCSFCGLERP